MSELNQTIDSGHPRRMNLEQIQNSAEHQRVPHASGWRGNCHLPLMRAYGLPGLKNGTKAITDHSVDAGKIKHHAYRAILDRCVDSFRELGDARAIEGSCDNHDPHGAKIFLMNRHGKKWNR